MVLKSGFVVSSFPSVFFIAQTKSKRSGFYRMKYGTFKHLWVSLILLDRKNEAAAAVIINHAAFLEEPLAKRYFPSWHCQVDHHGVVFLECAMQLFIYSLDHDSYRFRLKRWRGKSKITKTVPTKRFLNISQCLKISQKSLITLQEQGSKGRQILARNFKCLKRHKKAMFCIFPMRHFCDF